jgi:hypothetical protein
MTNLFSLFKNIISIYSEKYKVRIYAVLENVLLLMNYRNPNTILRSNYKNNQATPWSRARLNNNKK